MTFGNNCKLFGRTLAMGAVAYSDKGTMIKRCRFYLRTSTGELIFTMGPCEYDEDDKKFIESWSKHVLKDTFGIPELYPDLDPFRGVAYIQKIDESLLNNAYIEVQWFSVLEIKEYYAKIILTKSDIELLKELALNDGWSYISIFTGKKAPTYDLKQVNFIIRLSVGGIGFVTVERNNSDSYLLKPILAIAKDDQNQISRIQKLTQLKDLDYAQFFKEQYKDPDFLKTFEQARKIAKEAKSDVSKCYIFNNYGSIITSIRKSINFYKYKLDIDRRYKVAYIQLVTTAQERFFLIGKEIYEKTFIATPIKHMFVIIEIPDENGKKIWTEMRLTLFQPYITSCSSPNKEDKEIIIEYFSNLDELSGHPKIIGNNITVDQKGVNSIVDRKIYDRLNLITYTMTLDFKNNKIVSFIHNDQKSFGCPLEKVSIGDYFSKNPDKYLEDGNNKPVFPKGTEID